MNEEFEIKEIETTFDFKAFLFKILSFWPLFIVSIAIAYAIAYYINVRKLPVYSMESMISVKDDQNPFFTTNTSLTFNWGGTTDKVNTVIITLKSRSHNESVVEYLQYYVDYKIDGEYQKVDGYKKTPFIVEVDTTKSQLLNTEFTVVFKDSVNFTLYSTITEGNKVFQNYTTKEKQGVYINAQDFQKNYKIGDTINSPFFNGILYPNQNIKVVPGKSYYFRFLNFDNAVSKYSRIRISPESKGSSALKMLLTGQNKARLVDYLNGTVKVLSKNALERKNLFATKTIKYIDSILKQKTSDLKNAEQELDNFKKMNAVFDLEYEGQEIKSKLNGLDIRKSVIEKELNYFTTLEQYLISRTDYRNVPAPSVSGIGEASIIAGVGRIISLAEKRNKLQYSFKDGAPIFDDIDRQIDAVKTILLENLRSSTELKKQELASINKEIAGLEFQISKLPKEQQELLKIERRYTISEASYNLFLAKQSEARLVKAANVSDILVIDPAKDTGGGQIGPNTQLNYMLAALFGFLLPLMFTFLVVFFNTKINTVADIERISKIPVLGVVGKNTTVGNLAVLERPKSAIAEAFRALRSSLQFIYKRQGIDGAKTVLVTSSVSGEGKTFTSINIASVFALSEKKTVLLGLDLRKPKIFDDFNINNSAGVVNYLINDLGLEGIIQKTQLDHFDIITSGPIPPNPSELLMGERMELLINELKSKYDYIILDSPPLGLVSDSLELIKFADATIYMVRQNYTKKGMFRHINDKYRRGEVSNVSFVLNFYEDKASYGYGYGYGYGKYGNGYHEDGAKPSIWKKIKRFFKLSN
jgi:capsular exopolysaccharide synthesis family protein